MIIGPYVFCGGEEILKDVRCVHISYLCTTQASTYIGYLKMTVLYVNDTFCE